MRPNCAGMCKEFGACPSGAPLWRDEEMYQRQFFLILHFHMFIPSPATRGRRTYLTPPMKSIIINGSQMAAAQVDD